MLDGNEEIYRALELSCNIFQLKPEAENIVFGFLGTQDSK